MAKTPRLSEWLEGLRLARTERGPMVVGLDGRSGVGKSTLAQTIAAEAAGVVVGGDDFFAGGTTLVNGRPEQLADLCIDRLRLARVLEDLRAGKPARYRAFDWEAFDGRLEVQTTHLEPADLIIVEGVYSCHPDLHHVLDAKVLATAASDIRDSRLQAREGEIGPWERQWHAAEDWYFSAMMTEASFDWVIDASD
ncbi:hypothetical protein Q0812_08895 [Brevundimonas sp. 2R-24]|uniref:Phosphoribulokinase/uridine kinase domain-containing protein n=1 Tax=Peiella sedimenti TaxID=3061083 RepID=A0ABT8SLU7_9CAUL|nr:hypothetical protein [Caulobacteraceae bacterium XZ-24]